MNPHDVAHIIEGPDVVGAMCACGHLSEGPTKSQALKRHESHWGLAMSRAAIKPEPEAEAG